MATTNFNVQDLSSSTFKPINFKSKSARSTREEPYYKSAKVAPSSSTPVVAPKATYPPKASYPQLSMYDRWANDCQNVEVVHSVAPFVQVPMLERWTHDGVG
jgi:hypothetical protein